MEFHSTNPPPLPQYHYLAKAIITLYPTNTTANNNTDSLQRTTSRGSIGRRLSFGSAGKLDEDGDPVLGGAGGQNPERGGGLRNFARRLSFDTKGKDGKDAREGLKDEHATTGGAGAGVLDIAKTKTGKWATNVEVAVTATHLLVILSPDQPLSIYPPPPGAPGYQPKSTTTTTTAAGTNTATSPTTESQGTTTTGGTTGGTTGTTTTTATGEEHDESKHSIGRKIIDLFKPHSSTGGTSSDHPTETTPHPNPIPFPAPTPELAERDFPGVVNGKITRFIAVPLGCIKEGEVRLIDEKKEIGVRVPITAHFSALGDHEESSGRSGKIKFQFDRNWLGAKAEAEVLHHAITQGIENRRNAPAPTLSLGNTGSTQSRQGAFSTAPLATTQDVDPLDTSSEAKVEGVTV